MRKRLPLIAITLFCYLSSLQTGKAAPVNLMDSAAILYQEAQYREAIHLYRQVLGDGLYSFELYNNLGSSYFQTADYPRARLYFEKARRLRPASNLIYQNLDLVRKELGLTPVWRPLFLISWWQQASLLLGFSGWLLLQILSTLLVLASMVAWLFGKQKYLRKWGFWIMLLSFFASVVFYGLYLTRQDQLYGAPQAICMPGQTQLHSSPTPFSPSSPSLSAGMQVQIIGKLRDWWEVELPNGRKGWVHQKQIALIRALP